MRWLIGTLVCVSGLVLASCKSDGQEKAMSPGAHKSPTRTASPTPTTPDEVSAVIKAETRRLGTANVTIHGLESYKWKKRLRFSCNLDHPRTEFTTTVAGRQGQPANMPYLIIVDGGTLYTKPLIKRWADPKRPRHKGKLSDSLRDPHSEFNGMTQTLQVANCAQPGILAYEQEKPVTGNRPSVLKGSMGVGQASRRADGDAKDFYSYVKSLGVKKLEYTLSLAAGFRPKKYRLAVEDKQHAQSVSWEVTFDKWSRQQIKLPAKDEVKANG